ncbi:MAG: rane protein [Rhizobium sp.]|nr:rane protein [Rhizobium sp.]
MKLCSMPRIRPPARRAWIAVATLMLAAIVAGLQPAHAQEDNAKKILKAMSDYIGSQKSLSITFDSDIEVITNSLQKIQFTNSGQMQMVRPDKLWATRSGGYVDVDLVFDGATARVFGRHNNIYTEIASPGSVDQLIVRLRDEYRFAIPGADLLLSSSYDRLMEDVVDAKHIGQGVVDGVDCEHLAFRNVETDWQIWVEAGPRPIPRKYVITSKAIASAPQYTLRIKNWSTDAPISADAFVFKAPAGAKKVDARDLQDIDEVPAGVVAGGEK